MLRSFLIGMVALSPLVACGPIPVEDAERICVEDANLARRPRGRVALGVGDGGNAIGALDITISSDFLTGQDPYEVYNSCVKSRSGQFPTRDLADQPGWVG